MKSMASVCSTVMRCPSNDIGDHLRGEASSGATAVWVDCSILDSPRQLGMIEAGHAPAGYEPATASA